jgi:hypothetical protein
LPAVCACKNNIFCERISPNPGGEKTLSLEQLLTCPIAQDAFELGREINRGRRGNRETQLDLRKLKCPFLGECTPNIEECRRCESRVRRIEGLVSQPAQPVVPTERFYSQVAKHVEMVNGEREQ